MGLLVSCLRPKQEDLITSVPNTSVVHIRQPSPVDLPRGIIRHNVPVSNIHKDNLSKVWKEQKYVLRITSGDIMSNARLVAVDRPISPERLEALTESSTDQAIFGNTEEICSKYGGRHDTPVSHIVTGLDDLTFVQINEVTDTPRNIIEQYRTFLENIQVSISAKYVAGIDAMFRVGDLTREKRLNLGNIKTIVCNAGRSAYLDPKLAGEGDTEEKIFNARRFLQRVTDPGFIAANAGYTIIITSTETDYEIMSEGTMYVYQALRNVSNYLTSFRLRAIYNSIPLWLTALYQTRDTVELSVLKRETDDMFVALEVQSTNQDAWVHVHPCTTEPLNRGMQYTCTMPRPKFSEVYTGLCKMSNNCWVEILYDNCEIYRKVHRLGRYNEWFLAPIPNMLMMAIAKDTNIKGKLWTCDCDTMLQLQLESRFRSTCALYIHYGTVMIQPENGYRSRNITYMVNNRSDRYSTDYHLWGTQVR